MGFFSKIVQPAVKTSIGLPLNLTDKALGGGTIFGKLNEAQQNLIFGGGKDSGGGAGGLIDASGRPIYPEFAVQPAKNVAPNVAARMAQTTPTAQFRAQSAFLESQKGSEMARLRRLAQAQASEAQSRMAASGGITSGARERLQAQTGRDLQASAQELAGRTQEARLRALVEDAARRRGDITTQMQAEQFDVGKQLAQQQLLQQYLLGQYGVQGGIYGAEKMAQATLASAPKPG